jgi:membrane fusion protein, multidrug efflux system
VPKLPRARMRRNASYAAAFILVAAFAVFFRLWYGRAEVPSASATAAAPQAIPVQTAVVTRKSVPVYLEGLGTVQAFNTVTVTTRVDGALEKVDFVEGQQVNAGDVLAQIDPRPYQAAYDQALATKEKDAAQLANAKLDLQRYVKLAPQDYASRQTLDTQKALVTQLEAQLNIDQAMIASALTNLDYTTIRSPISGRTGIRLVDAGNNLLTTANTSLVVVAQIHPISVIFTLPEEDLTAVMEAMASGPVTAIALSSNNKTELDRGTVAVLDNEINQQTGTLRLKATFGNSKGTLWPGDFVNVKALVTTQRNVLTIPSTAVQRGPNGLYAYLVRSDATVAIRPIQLKQFGSGEAIITDGLQAGDRVVSTGQYRLQAGARIESQGSDVASTEPDEPSGIENSP